MPIEITSRHVEVAEEMKAHANDRAKEIMEEFPRVEHVHVILDRQKFLCSAEIVVQAKNHLRIEADDEDENIIKAIDSAAVKATKQLRRARTKVQDHHA